MRALLSAFIILAAVSANGDRRALLMNRVAAAAGGGGGIAFVQAYGSTSAADPLTVSSVTVPANGCILAFVTRGGGSDVLSTIKWNTTETFTVITNFHDKSSAGADIGAWILHNPTATTANVDLDYSTGPNGFVAVHLLVYTGVKADGGAAGAYRALTVVGDNGGSGTDISVAATSGDWVVGAMANWDLGDNATLAVTSHTSRRMDPNYGGLLDFSSQDSNGTVSGTTSITWSGDEFVSAIGLALIPQ